MYFFYVNFVGEDNWRAMQQIWETDDFAQRSAANRQNRAANASLHTLGSEPAYADVERLVS